MHPYIPTTTAPHDPKGGSHELTRDYKHAPAHGETTQLQIMVHKSLQTNELNLPLYHHGAVTTKVNIDFGNDIDNILG